MARPAIRISSGSSAAKLSGACCGGWPTVSLVTGLRAVTLPTQPSLPQPSSVDAVGGVGRGRSLPYREVMAITLLDSAGASHTLAGTTSGVDPRDLEAASGWAIKPEGLCSGGICVPLGDRAIHTATGAVDLVQWSQALGYLLAVDEELGVAAIVSSASGEGLTIGSEAPDVRLPDVDGHEHSLSELAGRKRVLVTWASWCGCRHEVGAWREVQNELGPAGLSIFSVALDNSAEDARPWVEAGDANYPVVVDSAHETAERYGITNVPSTVWIDEAGLVVKPPTISPGDDQFRDYTKIDSARHHDALRRWVNDGEVPEPATVASSPRTADEQLAQAERRIGAWLHGHGHVEAAAAHLARAVELAPWDWTVRRASIALRGEDPFLGGEFLAFWQEWDEAGRPGYNAMT
jgi:peroxiredoxin